MLQSFYCAQKDGLESHGAFGCGEIFTSSVPSAVRPADVSCPRTTEVALLSHLHCKEPNETGVPRPRDFESSILCLSDFP